MVLAKTGSTLPANTLTCTQQYQGGIQSNNIDIENSLQALL